MFPATQQLLERLARRYREASEWFDTIRRWYKDAKLTKRVIEELLRGEDLHLLRLQLNRSDDPAGVTRELDGHRVLLRIPAEHLQQGENTLTVGLSSDAERPVEVEGVLLGQPRTQIRQKIDLTVRHPEVAPAFHLIGHNRTAVRARCWDVLPNGFLTFRFYLHTVDAVAVALEMPRSSLFPQARSTDRRQRKLLKDVGKRVESRLKKWIDECAARKQAQEDGTLDDLRAYRELYERQIRLAIESDGSLQAVIDRTGNPDAIVSANARPGVRKPDVVELVTAPPTSMVAPHVNPPQAAPAIAGSSFAGKLLLTLLLTGLSTGAYAAWKLDGVTWLCQKWASLTAPTGARAGARGDVLTALRETGRELNWNNEVCQEIPREKMQAFLANFTELLGPQDAHLLDKVRTFMGGDRKNPMGEALLGFPVCENMLVVHDFADADALRRHFAKLPQQFRDGLQRFGTQGETSDVVIPHCDQAVRLTTRIGDFTQHQTMAQSGRFLLMTTAPDMSDADEQLRRLTALAKRLLHEPVGGVPPSKLR